MGLIVQLPVLPTEAMSLPGANPEATAATSGPRRRLRRPPARGHTGTARCRMARPWSPRCRAAPSAARPAMTRTMPLRRPWLPSSRRLSPRPPPPSSRPAKASGAQTAAEGAGVVGRHRSDDARVGHRGVGGDSNTGEAAPVVPMRAREKSLPQPRTPGDPRPLRLRHRSAGTRGPKTPGASTEAQVDRRRRQAGASPQHLATRARSARRERPKQAAWRPRRRRTRAVAAKVTARFHGHPQPALPTRRRIPPRANFAPSRPARQPTSEAPPAARGIAVTADARHRSSRSLTTVIEACRSRWRRGPHPPGPGRPGRSRRSTSAPNGDRSASKWMPNGPKRCNSSRTTPRTSPSSSAQRGLNLSGRRRGPRPAEHRDQAFSGTPGGQVNRPANGDEFAAILGIDDAASLDRHNRLRAAYNPMARCSTGCRRKASWPA